MIFQGYEEQARGRQEIQEAVGIAERKANALSGEVEESRALLDSADRAKRQLDSELADARMAVNEMQVINSKAMHDKRGLESVIHTLQAEIDDALQQAKNSEEKSKRAMVDAARLADELRSEQDHVNSESRAKRALDSQLGELETRLVAHCLIENLYFFSDFDIKVTYWYPEHSHKISAQQLFSALSYGLVKIVKLQNFSNF